MKVLVTGGAGFIGSHLVDRLIERGDTVVVVDSLASGQSFHLNPAAILYETSICAPELEEVFEHERPQVVFHLAAQTSVHKSVMDPGYDAKTNILGSLNVISNCVSAGVKKIVYASSSAIYGQPEYLPVDERHRVCPLSPYGVSKSTVEPYLGVYKQLFGLSYTILRFANVYGPRQNPSGEGGVIAIFADQMLSGVSPVIYGDGNKTRDYVYVDDVTNAIMLGAEYLKSDVFNIGTGIETRDDTVYEILSRACHCGEPQTHAPDRPGDIKHMYLDCSKAKCLLNWVSKTSLDEGIKTTVAYYSEQRQRSKR
jgi:UDP-glucose 4-epimerase